jgi:hypothetical protein
MTADLRRPSTRPPNSHGDRWATKSGSSSLNTWPCLSIGSAPQEPTYRLYRCRACPCRLFKPNGALPATAKPADFAPHTHFDENPHAEPTQHKFVEPLKHPFGGPIVGVYDVVWAESMSSSCNDVLSATIYWPSKRWRGQYGHALIERGGSGDESATWLF